MELRVIVNETFKDKYNQKKLFEAGKKYKLEAERVKEIQSVRPSLVTVLGEVPSTKKDEVIEIPEIPEISEIPEGTEEGTEAPEAAAEKKPK